MFFFSFSIVASPLFILVEEIEQMNSLFQQKQKELVLAVSKVEELTRQLEMLKNGRVDGHHDNQSAVAELDRLYKELQVSHSSDPLPPRAHSRPHEWQEVLGFGLFALKRGAGEEDLTPGE